MFDLGYKQLVLNDASRFVFKQDPGGTAPGVVAGEWRVTGFATFVVPFTTNTSVLVSPYTAGTKGEYTAKFVVATGAGPKNYVVSIVVKDMDAQDYGLNRAIKVHVNGVTDATGLADGVVAQLSAMKGDIIESATAAAGVLTIKLAKPSLFIDIDDSTATPAIVGHAVKVEELAGCADCNDGAITWPEVAATTPPVQEQGTGAWVASQIHQPFESEYYQDGQPVNLRGKYHTIYIETSADHEMLLDGKKINSGWLPHEMLGYGDANTKNAYARRRYVLFVSTAAYDAVMDQLDEFGKAVITGGTGTGATADISLKDGLGAISTATPPVWTKDGWAKSAGTPGTDTDQNDAAPGADDPILNP